MAAESGWTLTTRSLAISTGVRGRRVVEVTVLRRGRDRAVWPSAPVDSWSIGAVTLADEGQSVPAAPPQRRRQVTTNADAAEVPKRRSRRPSAEHQNIPTSWPPLLQRVRISVCFHVFATSGQWRIQKFLKGGGRKAIYQPRPHLSQMHTAIYRPFTRKKAAFWKNILANRGRPPPPPSRLNPPLLQAAWWRIGQTRRCKNFYNKTYPV